MSRPALALLLLALLVLTACDLLARFDASPPLPVVQADYPLCVTIKPGPLHPPRKPIFHPHNSELS